MKRIIFTLVILILLWLAACSPSPGGQDTAVNPEPEDTGGAAVVDDTAAPPDLPLIPAFNSGFLGPETEPPPFAHEGQLPAVGTAVIIGEVKLLYFPMILFPAEPTSASPYVNRILLLPVWKFFGQTDNDQRVEFLVPAVAPEYLQTSPRP